MEKHVFDEELDQMWLDQMWQACLKAAYQGWPVIGWIAMLEMKSCTIEFDRLSKTKQDLHEKETIKLTLGVQLQLPRVGSDITCEVIDQLLANAASHILISLNEHCHYEKEIGTAAGEQVSRDQWKRVPGMGVGKPGS